ncbi:hypothetical protein [Pleionea sp. CnH1-48]|uniref:hypothetical protein n=1 Tax=Pleionea sp. CnH1-48 TaxID=2954494 RepID=UPI0020971A33|nr:hypothetical protein [Pleionea sp. CnH1-48]MCO7226033.1 hypothetical protein [Pleionea sp. CnH1-48]
MFYTFLSLLVLVIAPLLERLSRGKQAFEHTLASFLIVVLGGIVLFEIIPLSYSNAGWITIPLILLGLSGPSLIEKLFRKAADSTHQVTLLIGICGLLVHAMIDGAMLNEYEHIESSSKWLALAILIHRVPVALMILMLLRPIFGNKGVWMGLASLGIFTLFGSVLGLQLEDTLTSEAFALMQSFVAGTLLHVLIHQPHKHSHEHGHDHSHSLVHELKHWGKYHVVGIVAALSTLVLLSQLHN